MVTCRFRTRHGVGDKNAVANSVTRLKARLIKGHLNFHIDGDEV